MIQLGAVVEKVPTAKQKKNGNRWRALLRTSISGIFKPCRRQEGGQLPNGTMEEEIPNLETIIFRFHSLNLGSVH